MDREATLQREPTCQAGGQKKNPEMQQCGVVPKGADISYAPRLTVTAPRTRGGPEMVSVTNTRRSLPPRKTQRLQVEGTSPQERRISLAHPARGRGLINPFPTPGTPTTRHTPRRSTSANVTTWNIRQEPFDQHSFCFIRNQNSFFPPNSKKKHTQ